MPFVSPPHRWRRCRGSPLGDGVWRRANDRFVRAVQRFKATTDEIEFRQIREELREYEALLDTTSETVRTLCERAQDAAPSSGTVVPAGHGGHYREIHHWISRAATLCALACDHAMQARVCARSRDTAGLREAMAVLRRTVDEMVALVDTAAVPPGAPAPPRPPRPRHHREG